MSWKWLSEDAVYAIHEIQITRFGGSPGARDKGLLSSALARPQNLAAYADPDFAALAASYAFGIARNHPFVDGNKRVAAVAMGVFLSINGQRLTATPAELALTFLALAAGELSEDNLAAWIRSNSKAEAG